VVNEEIPKPNAEKEKLINRQSCIRGQADALQRVGQGNVERHAVAAG
jgi:DNA-binding FrmR family transcriptional regulator